ncbi:unnamed protein product [Callosobruchus maculatus]|uniref:Uncharacterized protein n=1 Tax=Callosobruchus maculatus TaxID=64391 RepID=A0A653CS67_CALMS|nr:unnamed protein product [Callosobruchus maculatus]
MERREDRLPEARWPQGNDSCSLHILRTFCLMALGGSQAVEMVNHDQHQNICTRVGPECTQASAPAWAARSGWPERIRRDAERASQEFYARMGPGLRGRRPYSGNDHRVAV